MVFRNQSHFSWPSAEKNVRQNLLYVVKARDRYLPSAVGRRRADFAKPVKIEMKDPMDIPIFHAEFGFHHTLITQRQ